MIPTTSSRVNLTGLEPTLTARVDAMLADPRMSGYRVSSAVRTYAQQLALYLGWLARLLGFNRAANPDGAGVETFDGLRIRGSYHMVQDDGHGHAVDLRAPVYHSTAKRWSLVSEVGAEYGLRQTVRGEWWHLQARDRYHWFDAPRMVTQPLTEEDTEMQLINDPLKQRMFAGWVTNGTQHVDEYGTYIAGAGTDMPNISFVIDDQVKAGLIIKVG
jgi:hypothetical protein